MPLRVNSGTVTNVRGPRATDATSAANVALNRKATAWIKSNAGEGWGKKFPAIDSGNLGVSAFVPTPAQSKALLAAAKGLAPGLPALQAAKLDPAKQQLVVVLTSDDEPAVHLCLQDKKSGQMKHLGDVNAYDLSPDGDFSHPLTKLAKDAQWLPLGAGSAKPNWWE